MPRSLLLLLPSLFLGCATSGATLTARTLDIVDEAGRPRIRIGAPLPDPKVGRRAVKAYGIQWLDEAGEEIGGYAMLSPIGVHGLCFDSRRGYEAVCVGLIKEGMPEVVLRDQSGPEPQERIALRIVDGVALLELSDEAGRPRLRFTVDREGRSAVEGAGPPASR